MFAVAKEDAIEFVRYVGMHEPYPDWFVDFLGEDYATDEFGVTLYFNGMDDGVGLVIVNGDVLLRNKYGDIRHMNSWEFNDYFYEVQ